ncbi:MAG: hypothetical protein JWO38_1516 [Gemmataceae bacterium]|nr:hypothetical protein [Gemmataceae bacterium]
MTADEFLTAFETGTLTRKMWTHEAHVSGSPPGGGLRLDGGELLRSSADELKVRR